MMSLVTTVASLAQHWRVHLALHAALNAVLAVGAGCLAAFVFAPLGYPDQQVIAFIVGVLAMMVVQNVLVGGDVQIGAFAWMLMFAGAYFLMQPGWTSLAGGAFIGLFGSSLLVAYLM